LNSNVWADICHSIPSSGGREDSLGARANHWCPSNALMQPSDAVMQLLPGPDGEEGSDHESDHESDDAPLYMLNVQVISATELEEPGYQFGDLTRRIFGSCRLNRVYVEVRLGSQVDTTSKVTKESRNSFTFASEPLKLIYRGDEQLGVRVRDNRGMQLGGDPVVGEGSVPLSIDHRDGRQPPQVVHLRPGGRLKIQLGMQALAAEQADDALASAASAKFCNRAALQPWKEEYASLPNLDSKKRRKVVKFGEKAAVDPDEMKQSAVGKYKNCALVMRAGVPDSWKDFAWYHCSGAAAWSKKLEKESSTLASKYERDMLATFGDYVPQAFAGGVQGEAPLFNQGITQLRSCHMVLEEEWPHLVKMLTPDGFNKAKRILWTLNTEWSKADCCPWIPPMVLAILTFSSEHDAYAALHCLLKRSWRNEKTTDIKARIFLFCTREQFCRVVQQFVARMRRDGGRPKDILDQLRSKGANENSLIAKMLCDCLASVLPARAFLRLLGSVMIGGWKVVARYLAALLHAVSPALSDCRDGASAEHKIIEDLAEHAKSLTGGELDKFVNAAFKPDMQSRHDPYEKFEGDVPGISSDAITAANLAWPRGAMSSWIDPEMFNLLELSSLISLWSGPLPLQVRDCRLQLVFAPAKHGYTLEALASKCEDYGEAPMLLLVAASPDIVLGAYSPCPFQRTHQVGYAEQPGVDLADSFVFVAPRAPDREERRIDPTRADRALTLQEYAVEHKEDGLHDDQLRAHWGALERSSEHDMPKDMEIRTRSALKHYLWTDANKMLFHFGRETLMFGGPNPAISFDESLNKSTSHFCATFGSPPLSDLGVLGRGKSVRVGGRTGKIIIEDDSELPFKVAFNDGQVPEADWFRRGDLEALESAEDESFTFRPSCLEVFAFVD